LQIVVYLAAAISQNFAPCSLPRPAFHPLVSRRHCFLCPDRGRLPLSPDQSALRFATRSCSIPQLHRRLLPRD
jgi:hypothetical protein